MNVKALSLSAVPVLFALAFVLPSHAHAATPTLTANETAANVAETKATRSLTIANALPGGTVSASSVNFTIGDCVVTLGTVAQDTDCSDHAAAIATTTDTTAALIATKLLTVTGIADTGRAGGLTLTASSTSNTSVVFTTTATETAASNITYTASTATNVSSPAYATVTGVIPVAQQDTFTPGSITGNYNYEIGINGNLYRFAGANVKDIVEGLQPLVDADSAVTCTEDNTKVTCTADTAGTSFTYVTYVLENHSGGGSGSGGSGGSSGGGGGSSSGNSSGNAAMQARVTELLALIKTLQAQLGHGSTGIGAGVSAFARDLTIGASGDDVHALQVWLNAHGFMVAASGAGSVGNETTLFGGLTQAALAKWQASVGITPAVGFFGPKTRAYLAAHP